MKSQEEKCRKRREPRTEPWALRSVQEILPAVTNKTRNKQWFKFNRCIFLIHIKSKIEVQMDGCVYFHFVASLSSTHGFRGHCEHLHHGRRKGRNMKDGTWEDFRMVPRSGTYDPSTLQGRIRNSV